MGEYEPTDSRDVTLSDHQAPGEPPRTGPREDQARDKAQQEQGGQGSAPTQVDGRPIDTDAARKDAEDAARVHDADQSDEGDDTLHHKL